MSDDGDRPYFPRLDEAIHQAAFEHGVTQDIEKSYHHRPSNSSACVRNLAMTALGYPLDPTSGRTMIVFDDGNIHEDASFRWLKQSDFEVMGQQLSLSILRVKQPKGLIPGYKCSMCGEEVPGDTVHAHIDGLIVANNETFVAEHKALSHWTIEAIVKDGEAPNGYVTQTCLYIIGAQEAGFDVHKGILLMKNKNNASFLQFSIDYDREMDNAMVIEERTGKAYVLDGVLANFTEKCLTVVEAIKTKTLPERPYHIDDWQCRYCPRLTLCWENYGDELALRENEVDIQPGDELYDLLVGVREARDLRDANEELQRKLGRQAKELLKQRGIKGGRVGRYSFWEGAMKGRESLDKSRIPGDILALATVTGPPAVTLNVKETGRKKK